MVVGNTTVGTMQKVFAYYNRDELLELFDIKTGRRSYGRYTKVVGA